VALGASRGGVPVSPGGGSARLGGYADTHSLSRWDSSRSQRAGLRDGGSGDSRVGDGVSGDGGGLLGPLAVPGGRPPALAQLLPPASESV